MRHLTDTTPKITPDNGSMIETIVIVIVGYTVAIVCTLALITLFLLLLEVIS